jgi:hypothetical protein
MAAYVLALTFVHACGKPLITQAFETNRTISRQHPDVDCAGSPSARRGFQLGAAAARRPRRAPFSQILSSQIEAPVAERMSNPAFHATVSDVTGWPAVTPVPFHSAPMRSIPVLSVLCIRLLCPPVVSRSQRSGSHLGRFSATDS